MTHLRAHLAHMKKLSTPPYTQLRQLFLRSAKLAAGAAAGLVLLNPDAFAKLCLALSCGGESLVHACALSGPVLQWLSLVAVDKLLDCLDVRLPIGAGIVKILGCLNVFLNIVKCGCPVTCTFMVVSWVVLAIDHPELPKPLQPIYDLLSSLVYVLDLDIDDD